MCQGIPYEAKGATVTDEPTGSAEFDTPASTISTPGTAPESEPRPVDRSVPRSSSSLKEVLLVILGGLLAIGGGAVSQHLQNRAASNSRYLEVRSAEQREAVVAFTTIGDVMDAPLARATLVLEGVLDQVPDTTLERMVNEYGAARAEWILRRSWAEVTAEVYGGEQWRRGLALADSIVLEIDSILPRAIEVAKMARPPLKRFDRPNEATGESLVRVSLSLIGTRRNLLTITRHMWAVNIRYRRTGSFDDILGRRLLNEEDEARLRRLFESAPLRP